MKLIDTHAHLDFFQKEGKLAEVLANAKENNVERIIACSTTPSDWILYSEMSAQNQNIFWQAGIHPTEIAENDDIALDALSSLFIENKKHSAPVAIGEIGLDFYRLPNDEEEAENKNTTKGNLWPPTPHRRRPQPESLRARPRIAGRLRRGNREVAPKFCQRGFPLLQRLRKTASRIERKRRPRLFYRHHNL